MVLIIPICQFKPFKTNFLKTQYYKRSDTYYFQIISWNSLIFGLIWRYLMSWSHIFREPQLTLHCQLLLAAICIEICGLSFHKLFKHYTYFLVAVIHFLGFVHTLPFLSYCCTEQGVQNWSQKRAYVPTFFSLLVNFISVFHTFW